MNKVLIVGFALLALAACLVNAGEYGVPVAVAEERGDLGGYGGGYGGGGGWGGLSSVSSWRPKFRYLNVRIPVPILPRIRIGVQTQAGNGWGWK